MKPEVLNLVEELARACVRRGGETVATAESCTGGLISSWIVAYPGASKFFLGGVTSYSRQVKVSVLKVRLTTIQVFGEVSVPVALGMAEGARTVLEASWTVSVTGIAGPSGGTPEKPVGFVCFGVVGPGVVRSTYKQFAAAGGREDIQQQAAEFALRFLLNEMR